PACRMRAPRRSVKIRRQPRWDTSHLFCYTPTPFEPPTSDEIRMSKTTTTSSANDKAKAGQELMRALDTLERERGIPREMAFSAIERAIRLAIGKHFGDDDDVDVQIDRAKGLILAKKGDKEIDPHSGELGRIAAQAAK